MNQIEIVEIQLKDKWLLRVSKFINDKIAIGLTRSDFTLENQYTQKLFLDRFEAIKLILSLELLLEDSELEEEKVKVLNGDNV